MKSISIVFCAFFAIFLSCKPAQYTESQITAFENFIESKSFSIESDRAQPQVTNAVQQVFNSGILQPGSSASSISLIGNANFITISGDSITSYLPYFGERQMNVSYTGGDSAIQLIGVMKNYTTTKNKDHSVNISFDAKSKQESFKVQIKLYPSLKAETQVLCNSRFPISYSGKLKEYIE